jgi:carboxyl-terminal processing protease
LARQWFEACQQYEAVLREDRGNAEAREGYMRCLRRVHLANRHRDPAYREAISKLRVSDALDIYEQILQKLSECYVDRQKTDLTMLFQQGVAEFRFALEEDFFQNEYLLPEVTRGAVLAFRPKLDALAYTKVKNLADARQQMFKVLRAAQDVGLVPRATNEFFLCLVVIEFACGACNGLDEYTLFLTPRSLRAPAPPPGKAAGIGVELGMVDQKLKVSRVYPKGPARAWLSRHDEVLAINGQRVGASAEAAMERLRGEPGTAVELEVVSAIDGLKRTVTIVRQAVPVPTVDFELLTHPVDPLRIGWVRIYEFRENTVQEVREALAQLQTDDIKALILDLRGNPGGLFRAAVQVAGLFLGEAVIAVTQSPLKSKNPDKNFADREWKTEAQNPFPLPLVVLIDGETASAAEVLAGALKDHKRAELVGQTTFGKGTLQAVITLDTKAPGGIRITFAKFYSPTNKPFSGRGVSPDLAKETTNELGLLEDARKLLRFRLGWEPPPPGMLMPPTAVPMPPPPSPMPGASEALKTTLQGPRTPFFSPGAA